MWNASALLKPIRPERPAGDDLSFSRDFDAIAKARRFDDPSLDQGEWEVDLKEADWNEVIVLTTALLERQSKDLRLAVWLTEASVYQHGFDGLTQGFELIAGLCESYWDILYPEAEGGDQERRAGNLSWIVTSAEQLVRTIPLTEGRGTGYSYANILETRNRAQGKGNSGCNDTGISIEAIDSARRKSSYAFYQARLAEAQRCAIALTRLQAAIDARLGMDGPSFTALRQGLDDVTHTLTRFANDQGVPAKALAQETCNENNTSRESPMNPLQADVQSRAITGAILNRSQAIAQLREVARYFRETEPHSPVAYLADKAAQWGNLPLHEWLRTVIKDNASLSHVEELLGLAADSDNGSA
jgi:type VI secretion-associated protein, ImpA family